MCKGNEGIGCKMNGRGSIPTGTRFFFLELFPELLPLKLHSVTYFKAMAV
jgi:hypothetical protein